MYNTVYVYDPFILHKLFRYNVEETSKKIVYKKMHKDYENDHTHNKETHIIKATGKLIYTISDVLISVY